jgi:hypothetical protein
VKKLLLPVMALLVATSVSQAAVKVVWKSDFGIYNEAGTGDIGNLLPVGSIVQLIKAGADGVASDLDFTAPDLAGGDDMVIDQTVIGMEIGGTMYGGIFSSGPTIYDSVGASDYLFIRAFNATDLAGFAAAGGYYGNGPLVTGFNENINATPPPTPDQVVFNDGVTDIWAAGGASPIPEPSTVMLALAGALMVLRKIRK